MRNRGHTEADYVADPAAASLAALADTVADTAALAAVGTALADLGRQALAGGVIGPAYPYAPVHQAFAGALERRLRRHPAGSAVRLA